MIAITRFKRIINNKPQIRLISIARLKEKNKKDNIKERVKTNFPTKTLTAEAIAAFCVIPLSVFFEEYMLIESDNESATATLTIPAITASFEEAAPSNPTITPKVVKTPPDIPNANFPKVSQTLWKNIVAEF